MELVRGQDLREYADGNDLSVRLRLEVMGKVCDAVQHAHQKGVIHRDLKPGNILVDESGQPKILDFGVAPVTDSDIGITTIQTDVARLIGTIPYMSPEQVSADPSDLDTRSDVYALGVITYELLAGRLPYDLREKMIHEAVRVIREDDPTPLSSVNRALRGDVETIVAKALEKDKVRRYPAASALAADIRRYLDNEPIAARPASAMYQLSKFARRNRALVGGIIAVFVVLVVGVITSTLLYIRAEKQRVRAEKNEAEAVQRTYVADIHVAQIALDHNENAALRRALDACPASLRGWEWRYLDARSDQSLFVLRGPAAEVHSAAFSPDGTRVVTAVYDKTARVWDTATGKELAVLRGHEGEVHSAAFSPDGTRIVTASADKTARVWDAATGKELGVWRGHVRDVTSAAFSPDGTRIVTASGDRTAWVWEAATRKELTVFRKHAGRLPFAAFSPDGTRIVTASVDKTARVWEAATGKELPVLRGHEGEVNSAAFNPDGTRIVTASGDKTARVWDAATGEQLAELTGMKDRSIPPHSAPMARGS
jgi:predicted oxidoreductase (fatty acid repression mutant protein)